MLASLDSATPPTPAQVAAARAAGIGMWCVYIATKPNVSLLRPWSDTEIEVVRPLNPQPIAFYSGWDDAAAIKAKAARLHLRPCLDDESGIRSEGAWVQPNLDAVGGGLYGTSGVHVGRRAAFHIAAFYPTPMLDPRVTWPAGWPRPTTPCGWQWQNTHTEFGVGVDRSWLDDWFGGPDMTQQEHDWLASIVTVLGLGATDPAKWPVATPNFDYPKELAAIKARLAAIESAPGGTAPSYQGTVTLTPK